jgi:nickel-type superoxide dismutase maturation protease
VNHFRSRLLAGTAAVALALAVAARRLQRLEVVGESMLPVLEPGDRVLVWRGARCRPGDLVALIDPTEPARTVVKRVSAVGDRGWLSVLGDNPQRSTDSRHYGPVASTNIKGLVLYRYAPEARRGRLGPVHPESVGNR